jgi:4a-hydroxytetrahydrobiopterin dehydratase
MGLAEERCQACTGSTPVVTGAELETLRAELSADWQVVEGGRKLHRVIRYPDFVSAFIAATRIAFLAEAEEHHPDLAISWGRLEIDLSTHAVGGLTRNDFILAAKIDAALGGTM